MVFGKGKEFFFPRSYSLVGLGGWGKKGDISFFFSPFS